LARLVILAGLAAAALGFAVDRIWGWDACIAFLWGAALSTVVCYAGFLLTVWAIPRSPNAQLASVVFGFLGRLFTLSAAVFVMSRFGGFAIMPLGLSIVAFYFIDTALEMLFLYRVGLIGGGGGNRTAAAAGTVRS